MIRSHTRALPPTDPWTVLAEAETPRMAWHQSGDAFVASGAAILLTSRGRDRFDVLRRRAAAVYEEIQHEGPGSPRFVGGFALRFDHRPEGLWSGFPATMFWLPRRLVHWVEGRPFETTVETDETPRSELMMTDEIGQGGTDGRTIWTGRAARVLRSMGRLDVQKAVLARTSRHDAADATKVLRRLATDEPNTTRYLVDPHGSALVGATPERLVKVKDGQIETHALAGSTPVTGDRDKDMAAARRLAGSRKEETEHALVHMHLMARLNSVGASVTAGPRRLRRLRAVQHLETPITGAASAHVLEAVQALHPTPAVAGAPVDQALKLLEHVETVPRGWYTGGVGWFDGKGNGEIAVALRCGLLRPDSSWLYAGAGLMPDSDPAQEWDETEAKLDAMRSALG